MEAEELFLLSMIFARAYGKDILLQMAVTRMGNGIDSSVASICDNGNDFPADIEGMSSRLCQVE